MEGRGPITAVLDFLKERAGGTAQTPVDAAEPFPKGTNARCLVEALTARGIAYRYVSRTKRVGRLAGPSPATRIFLAFQINGVDYYFRAGLHVQAPDGPLIDGRAAERFVKQKYLVRSLLRDHGFSVPEGEVFRQATPDKADAYFMKLSKSFPEGACVKPDDGRGGKFVYVGVRDCRSFVAAYETIRQRYDGVLVEEAVSGQSHRFLCLGGRVVAIACWRTANVEGDGVHTIAELIDRKSAERALNPAYAGFPLRLGPKVRKFLAKSGLGPRHLPEAGGLVFLRAPPHEDEAMDVTDRLHPSYAELVARAVALVPDLVLCGVDVMIQDPDAPATPGNHHILEFNTSPRFVDHHYPWRGQSRDVAGAVVDYLADRTDTP